MRRLLLVEDSPSDVELFREALGEGEPTVELDVARHGEEAMDRLGRPPAPDLVVLDLNLPRMNGMEVLAAVREHADAAVRRLPVVVFTTSRAPSDVLSAYDLHASSFVTKPTGFPEYLEVIGAFREFWLHVARVPAQVQD